MRLLTTAEEVSDVAFGFMASKALFTAIHFNLFSHLAKAPLTAQQAAEQMGIHPDRATTLMTALTTIGLLGRENGVYHNAPAAESFLVNGAKYDFSDYLSQQVDQQMYGLLDQIEEAMADKLPDDAIGSYAEWMSDPAQAKLYSDSQHAGSLGPARTLARNLDLSNAGSMLDVGGGTGAYAITLCKANPDLQATVIDFPNVASLGEQYVADAGLQGRVNYVPGDLHDFMVEPDRTGPKLAALWQFQHTAFNPHARSVSTDWAQETISSAGFEDASVEPMIPGMTSVVSAVLQPA